MGWREALDELDPFLIVCENISMTIQNELVTRRS